MKKIILVCIALISMTVITNAQTAKKKAKKKVVKKATAAKKVTIATATLPKAIDSVTMAEKPATGKPVPTEKTMAEKVKEAADAAQKILEAAKGTTQQQQPTVGKTDPIPTSGNTGTTDNGSTSSNSDIISGLKEALRIGTDNSSKKLNKLDGFFADAAIKILMPEEAKKVEKTLRGIGMGGMVDNAILSMNRAAEDAAGGIGSIFWDAIRQMNITDGLQILRGGDFAATDYLKRTTTTVLTAKFRPVIENSLAKTEATKYWKDVFSAYNNFSSSPVNTDLSAYVTEKALSGLFYNISLEEQKIRKDPVAQVTDLLKTVFGKR